MKLEILILGITSFLIMNIYHDGKYIRIMKTWQKYYQMAFFGFVGLSLYIFIKKHPSHSRSLFTHANSIVKYMPIDKESSDFISPLLNITSHFSKNSGDIHQTPQYKRMLNSGSGNTQTTKRSVSETKKKFIASNQNWKCAHCNCQLQAWYEIDHKIRLENGGDNHINNLVALCRNCHGEKTAMESMI